MADESKQVEPAGERKPTEESPSKIQPKIESEDEDEHDEPEGSNSTTTGAKKKKSKRKRIKAALTGGNNAGGSSSSAGDGRATINKAISGLSKDQLSTLLSMNPSLASELRAGAGDKELTPSQAAEALKKLSLEEIMTGLSAGGKNAKEMGAYKFWATQPVPQFTDKPGEADLKEGPIKTLTLEQVPKEPGQLLPGFDWVTLDMASDEEVKELFELLDNHYVEDNESMFRFSYSRSFLKWALLAPGWKKEWHVGIRVHDSRKLVAFISAIPISLRVRGSTINASEVNFLCIHKKLRNKRLAPVLIKEVTRRCNLEECWQAIYTGGTILPRPVATCRYFHRALDWMKLYECKFSPCPSTSKPSYQVRKYALPENTATKGLRVMEEKDVDEVLVLLKEYLKKFEMAPVFTREEVSHWFVNREDAGPQGEQVVWSYVVEDPSTKKLTSFFSFYVLPSTALSVTPHVPIRAAYLYYYAVPAHLSGAPLRTLLNSLMSDALILAKKQKFDVFNALTLLDNNSFLEEQKFGRGDGQLHYYLYNYGVGRPINGGADGKGEGSGVGVVML